MSIIQEWPHDVIFSEELDARLKGFAVAQNGLISNARQRGQAHNSKTECGASAC
jgi:hypothetical protein